MMRFFESQAGMSVLISMQRTPLIVTARVATSQEVHAIGVAQRASLPINYVGGGHLLPRARRLHDDGHMPSHYTSAAS